MEFRIADTFTDSLIKLENEEQKAVKTTVFDLQINPANPGMKFHRIEKAKDQNFWSIRVSRDIRLIVHKSEFSFLICYVNHHDKAYNWAERRKIERHPKTGAAQLVEIRETIKEVIVPKYKEAEIESPQNYIFNAIGIDELLNYGVPEEWLDDVKNATDENIFEVAEHLPAEASEAILELATGGTPKIREVLAKESNSFEHPDAKRRFQVMSNSEELQRALEFPWEKWTIFLHPDQQSLVEKNFNGAARVSGSAGTGKTIVALHRAVYLAKNNYDARVLLTTFSDPLSNSLKSKLKRLISNEPKIGERLEIHSIFDIGFKLYQINFQKPEIAKKEDIINILKRISSLKDDNKFSIQFLWNEWNEIVDAWQLKSWEEYKDVKRLGRKKRLSETQRSFLWEIYEELIQGLKLNGLITKSKMFTELSKKIADFENPPFDFAIIDESQDISISELKFLAALGKDRSNSLFFTGDLGQRIFQQPFSWKSLGVDIRGRSQTLKVNYRTSHQIRFHADKLLPQSLSDVDGNNEGRNGTISVFPGIPPKVNVFDDIDSECTAVSSYLLKLINDGLKPHEISIFVRSKDQLDRAHSAVEKSNLSYNDLDENIQIKRDNISISTMHLAKGLEFRAVIIMACDDDVLPLPERIESVTDESDLEEVYQTERHLLYVACTRARDYLYISAITPGSEFLEDITE